MNRPLRNPQIVWRVEKRRRADLVAALEAGEETADVGTVTLIQSGMMHQLNLVGGMIWERCDGQQTIEQIVAELATEFDVAPAELRADVEAFVADLAGKGWLTDAV
ncbi:MAG: pyrroloquinoline quinone biosynthesis peptide chaperone PqqD [Desulfuromonadales bacterium]|nr:pyrroloquinoline quinone biosynthesis peptide chaperone PqqD [Desulfuromonadales bacterium]